MSRAQTPRDELGQLVAEALRVDPRPTRARSLPALPPVLLGGMAAAEAVDLLAHLLPGRTRAPADGLAWTELAAAQRKEGRDGMLWVRCQDGAAIGTDGRRLHMAESALVGWHNVRAGKAWPLYAPMGAEQWTTPCGHRFPDPGRIIPQPDPAAPWWDWGSWDDAEIVTGRPGSSDPGGDVLVRVLGVWLLWDYLADAMAGAEGATVTVQRDETGRADPQRPIRLDIPGGRVAVIMPRWAPDREGDE
jgi:hypothetical protein